MMAHYPITGFNMTFLNLQLTVFQLALFQLAKRCVLVIITLGFLLGLLGCAGNAQFEQANIYDADALAIKPVFVAPVSIEFSSAWLRQHRRSNTPSEIATLKQRYTQALTRSLNRALEKQGYILTQDSTGIKVQLNLSNMRISAPDFKGSLVDLYTQDEHGSCEFELTFSQADKIIARFKDYRLIMQGPPNQLIRTNRVLNLHAFDRALNRFIKDALQTP